MRKSRTARICRALGAWLAVAALLPALAAAASISGTVSDENTDAGIGGIEVCPTPRPYSFETECTETDAGGHYSLDELLPAAYVLRFSAWRDNLRYVDEYYDDKRSNTDADAVTLSSPEESRQVDVELATGGSIGGTVSDDATGAPVAEVAACAWNFEDVHRCDISDAAGGYEINGLPDGEYFVEYEGWNRVNYQREFYADADFPHAVKVPVLAPAATAGIDAELAQGAEILGHVSEAGSAAPVAGAMVCAPLASAPPGDFDTNCDWTDAAGDYAIRGLPAGTYVVGFDLESGGPFGGGPMIGQWWKEASDRSEATPLELATPQSATGVDGQITRYYWSPPPPAESAVAATAVTVPLLAPKSPLPRCRKGFHRKLVKGKRRCVRKQRPQAKRG
jgi:hypothetical protein